MTRSQIRFRAFAWAFLGYTVLVILWGAVVRATGSGAGCGDHWPLCNGEVTPRAPSVETLIEFSHRLTSGLVGVLAIVMVVWAWRAFAKGSPVRKAAAWTLLFTVTEGAVGAGLVLLEHVAYNVSVARAWWMAAHLLNTFLLLTAATLTAWWAGGHPTFSFRQPGGVPLLAACGATLVLGMSGSVAALGDTLSIGGGIDPTSDPIVGTLVGLRIYHPVLACLTVALVAWAVHVVRTHPASPSAVRLGNVVLGLFLVQLGIGLVNVWLMAPVWMQVVHLLVTDAIWVGLVLFAAQALIAREPAAVPAAVPA